MMQFAKDFDEATIRRMGEILMGKEKKTLEEVLKESEEIVLSE